MDEQNERAFQKQRGVPSGNGKRSVRSRKPARGKGGARFWKSPGLGFKVPREAIEGKYIDNKCPFTSDVSIRGRILSGIVKKHRMQRTLVVRRDYLHFLPKYQRYEKRHTNMTTHVSPAFRVFEGDKVIMGECRPLSKTKRFNVLKVISQQGSLTSDKKGLGSI